MTELKDAKLIAGARESTVNGVNRMHAEVRGDENTAHAYVCSSR